MPRLIFPVLSALCLAVVFWAAGISLGISWIPRWTSMDAQAVEPSGEIESAATQRCTHCGWIESKREILSTAEEHHARGTYEYTMRRSDGTRSVFREKLPVRWSVGERLIYIDGANPRIAPLAATSRAN